MVLDSRIQKVKDHFGIFDVTDWSGVRPQWILSLPDVGQVTLDHIRLYLSSRNLTLLDDRTPEYWHKHLSDARICHTMGDAEEGSDHADVCEFTVLVDTLEQAPFTFQGITQDADKENRPLIIPTEPKGLGVAMGDYAIQGFEGYAHIERKSASDAASTILGWGEHRERFIRELSNLAQMEASAVVVECTLGQLVNFVKQSPPRGKKTPAQNSKILYRQILGWQQDFRVPWVFCDSRRLAEITTFRILERFWNHKTKSQGNPKQKDLIDASHNEEAQEPQPVF